MTDHSTGANRWDAATRIQCQWRSHTARSIVNFLLAQRRQQRFAAFDISDRLEACLLIQTRMRMFLARKRVTGLRMTHMEKVQTMTGAVHVHPSQIDPRLLVFSGAPPTDDEVLDLFDAMDPKNTGKIPRSFARAVFDFLLSDLHPGDPTSIFDAALRTRDEEISPSALYLVVLRALAM